MHVRLAAAISAQKVEIIRSKIETKIYKGIDKAFWYLVIVKTLVFLSDKTC